MTDHERLISGIEQGERWLRLFESPIPDRVTLERVRAAVHMTAGLDVVDARTAAALQLAKDAVRRAIHGKAGGRSGFDEAVLRLWGPVGVVAAAAALAFSVSWSVTRSNDIRDPDLAAFVAIMSRPPDAALTTLLETEDAILGLTELDDSWNANAWGLPLLDDDFEIDGDWWVIGDKNGAS